MPSLDRFLDALRAFRAAAVFNPWSETDRENDLGGAAPAIRTRQLETFLKARIASARYALIGEAAGYQGAHFSGIAMMSERILLGRLRGKGILPEKIVPGLEPERTSKPSLRPEGFAEPTATIVWDFVFRSGRSPLEFVTWNAFAWHPFDPRRGVLSNRRPGRREAEAGIAVLRQFLGLFRGVTAVAVGKIAHFSCEEHLGIVCRSVRHPAQGGAARFRKQMAEIFKA